MKVWELKEILSRYNNDSEITINIGEDNPNEEIVSTYVLTNWVNEKPVVSIRGQRRMIDVTTK